MHDVDERESGSPEEAPERLGSKSEPEQDERADWARAAGVSGEHVFEDEPLPRLHWALIVLGPLGLATATSLSLWSSSQHVQVSVNVQTESIWQTGEHVAVRTQVLDADLLPLAGETTVTAELIANDEAHALGALIPVGDGLAQNSLTVPELAPGPAELRLHYSPPSASGLVAFSETLPIELVEQRAAKQGEQVVAESMLQWADDTDPQPADLRIDLRFAGRLLAGFSNTVFVRVTDLQGRPWAPNDRPAKVQVRLVSGEWGGSKGDLDEPPVVFEGPLDRLGLASFSGALTSEVVRFEVRLPAADPPKPAEAPPTDAPSTEGSKPSEAPPAETTKAPDPFGGPKRRLRFVSHAGTAKLEPSTDVARPGESVKVAVEAISARKPVFVDVHDPKGAWITTITPPMIVPQQLEWEVPPALGEGLIQFEGYQAALRPEESTALARVQITASSPTSEASLDPLIALQREQLALPRVDKQFEVGREKVYLDHLDTAKLEPAEVARARSFLLGSLEPVVHGPPHALDTRAREDTEMAEFKRRWTLGIRWFLLGGGGLFILVMSALLWRNQRRLELQTSRALGLVEKRDSPLDRASQLDAEELADQSMMIARSRQQLLVRGVLLIVLAVCTLALTLVMLEALVWEY